MEYIQKLIHITEWQKLIPDYELPKAIRFYAFILNPLYLAGLLQ